MVYRQSVAGAPHRGVFRMRCFQHMLQLGKFLGKWDHKVRWKEGIGEEKLGREMLLLTKKSYQPTPSSVWKGKHLFMYVLSLWCALAVERATSAHLKTNLPVYLCAIEGRPSADKCDGTPRAAQSKTRTAQRAVQRWCGGLLSHRTDSNSVPGAEVASSRHRRFQQGRRETTQIFVHKATARSWLLWLHKVQLALQVCRTEWDWDVCCHIGIDKFMKLNRLRKAFFWNLRK